ncbi:MAG TPA: tetratricopeptide repeat protein, partial [Chthoniobacterales bacterium]|nr:tetratricopeptide repeat protein [Chthoniobacterales bacterium]
EIARQLGVAHILEGSVQKSGDAVRVNVQLIKAANDSHLWADTFDRKLTDIFIVESEVAKTIADTLRAKLTGREEKAITLKPTANPEAYDAFLRGRASEALQMVSFKNRFIAADFYTKAVSLDADFALAWARLGIANAMLYRLGQDHTPQRREQVRQAAETALRLQPDLGEAHVAMGYYFFHCLSDYDHALQLLDQALTLLPNNTDAIATIGFIKRRQGKFSEALAQLERATELDPRNLTSLRELATTHAFLRQFAQARAIYNRALEIVPNDPEMIAEKAHTYLEEGDLAAAAKLLGPVLSESLDNYLLKVQCIQLLFERKYAPASAALKAAIARADKTLGVEIGAYYLLLLVAQQGSGDTEAARQTCEQALNGFSAMQKAGNESEHVASLLGLFYAAVGNRDAAMREARRAAAVAAHDALNAAATEEMLARTQVQLGDFDAAISTISHNLQGPSATFGWGMPLTRATLKIDPTWDPLRGDPRFQKLVASPAPKDTK